MLLTHDQWECGKHRALSSKAAFMKLVQSGFLKIIPINIKWTNINLVVPIRESLIQVSTCWMLNWRTNPSFSKRISWCLPTGNFPFGEIVFVWNWVSLLISDCPGTHYAFMEMPASASGYWDYRHEPPRLPMCCFCWLTEQWGPVCIWLAW